MCLNRLLWSAVRRLQDRRRPSNEITERRLQMTYPIKLGLSRAFVALASCSLVAFAAEGDWTTVGGDVSQTKYSTLKQITPANVSRLTKVWAWAAGGRELTPL